MRNSIFSACLLLLTAPVFSQSPRVYSTFEEMAHRLWLDTVLVANFWATWCKPCVAELPHFEELPSLLEGKPVKVLLVSIDFRSQVEKKLVPFLHSRKIKSEVVVLGDSNGNNWIEKVDASWSGAIPATLVVRGERRQFFEREFESAEELKGVVEPFLK